MTGAGPIWSTGPVGYWRGRRASGAGCGAVAAVIAALVVGGIGLAVFAGVREGIRSTGPIRRHEAGALQVGRTVDGDLATNTFDAYTFRGTGDVLLLQVDGRGDLDTVLEVREGGRLLDSDDDTNGRDPQLTVSFEEGHSYEVRVRAFSSTEDGDYRLTATNLGPSAASGEGNTAVDGGTLEIGSSVSGAVGDDQVVDYSFRGDGRPHTFTVDAVGDFDPTIAIIDADGDELGFDDDSGAEGVDSLLELTIPEGETVTVEVAACCNTRAGAFTVSVR
jgi:hypothetical protein